MIEMLKLKIKQLQTEIPARMQLMGYFVGDEATEIVKKAYRVGALSALDELLFFVEKIELE